jgi:hypothetical protein
MVRVPPAKVMLSAAAPFDCEYGVHGRDACTARKQVLT